MLLWINHHAQFCIYSNITPHPHPCRLQCLTLIWYKQVCQVVFDLFLWIWSPIFSFFHSTLYIFSYFCGLNYSNIYVAYYLFAIYSVHPCFQLLLHMNKCTVLYLNVPVYLLFMQVPFILQILFTTTCIMYVTVFTEKFVEKKERDFTI